MRVVVHGATPLHDRLHADDERYVAEVRNLALERGADRLWIEKVELQTRPTRSISVPDGPIEELREVLDELRADPGALAALGKELTELKRKLPAELMTGADAPRLGDPEWLLGVLDQVQPLLLDLLLHSERGSRVMRFLRLDLKAVGPFSGATLDLSGGDYGLHLIHGPNEAGKTSTLRALSYLLFGFPLRTSDDFVHPYDQLRVGAVLRHSDGEVLEVVRRKAAKNPLRGPDDTVVVPPERLERFLGGLDQDSFETLFGIDHARLARAGDEIRNGQGRLGELLFTAGTGLAGLRLAQDRLQSHLDLLFKPRGQNPRINQALG